MADMSNRKRAMERVDNMRNALADALNGIETNLEMFQFECDFNHWNDDVCMQIQDGCTKLGFALATICNWWKGEEEEETKQ